MAGAGPSVAVPTRDSQAQDQGGVLGRVVLCSTDSGMKGQ